MTNFRIEYNPYLITYSFYKNGDAIFPKKIVSKSNQRLQAILSPAKNWDGLIAEIARVCNETVVRITFKGRKIDFDDLLYGVEAYTGPVKFECVLEEVKSEDEILAELDKVIAEIKSRNLPQFSQVDESGRSVFDAYEEAKNGIFDVSVIATMSSGKSTLINSLLHTELLPSENKACTATIARIFDNDQMGGYEAECYGGDGTVVYPRTSINSDLLRSYNADESVQEIVIEGRIPSIKEGQIKLCLVDTPGPNNSRNENHGRLTRSIIKNPDSVILYVMNATQIGINDDHQLLLDISNQMKRAGKQSRDRFIFVINKCDELDVEKGETIDKLLNEIRQYLLGFEIEDPLLIPTSARLALIIRKTRNGEMLSKKERAELNGAEDFLESELLHFDRYATITPSVRAELTEQIAGFASDDTLRDLEILVHTGVPVVEAVINEYINKYAYPIKINDAVKNILNLIKELNMRGQFEQSIASDVALLARVREQIQIAQNQRSEGRKNSKEYKEEISLLSIDVNGYKRKTSKQIEDKKAKLLLQYRGQHRVETIFVQQRLDELTMEIQAYQRELESTLIREIETELCERGNELLEKYVETAATIIEDITIPSFDFRMIASFSQIRLQSSEDILEIYQETEIKNVTKYRERTIRDGLIGWWDRFYSLFSPTEKYIETITTTYVDWYKVASDIITEFNQEIEKNISEICKNAEEKIEQIRAAFRTAIDQFDDMIDDILVQLGKDTCDQEMLERRVRDQQADLDWLLGIENTISILLKQ